METNHSEVVRKMDKQALRVYGSLAGVVYSTALAYCYLTNHLMEMGIVGGVMLGLGILILRTYSSIGKESKSHEIGNIYKNVA